MSLAAVLLPSPTKQGWNEWSFHNFQHHLAIDSALLQLRGLAPQQYRLWPVREEEFRDWLEQHQLAHTTFCNALGIAGIDISDLDMKDKAKRDFWFFAHFQQHLQAAEILGLPSL